MCDFSRPILKFNCSIIHLSQSSFNSLLLHCTHNARSITATDIDKKAVLASEHASLNRHCWYAFVIVRYSAGYQRVVSLDMVGNNVQQDFT